MGGSGILFQPILDPAGWLDGALADPTVAYLLLVGGLSALLFELAFPGQIVPGAIGVILTLLSLFLFGTLPIDFVGVLLVLIAFVMFAAEVLAPGFGGFGAAGVVSLVLGSFLLTRAPGGFAVSPLAATSVVLAFGGFTALVWRSVRRTANRPVTTGGEGLVGAVGETRTKLAPRGFVFVEGELWEADAPESEIGKGAKVEVLRVNGRRLVVCPLTDAVAHEREVGARQTPSSGAN